MQRMTIGGAFSAMFDFIRGSWHVVLGSLVAVVVLSGGVGFAMIGTGSGEPSGGQVAAIVIVALVFYVALFACFFLGWRHGLANGQESVISNIGWAMGAGAASILSMFLVGIIVGIAFYAVLLIVALIMFAILGLGGMAAGDMFSPAAAAGMGIGAIALFALIYIATLVGYLWIYGRLSIAGPAMAVLRTRNPITGLGESWRLTRDSQWTIVGFYFLLAIIGVVLFMGMFIAIGGSAAALGAAETSVDPSGSIIATALVPLLLYIPALLVSVAAPAAVYRQVSGGERTSAEIFT